MYLIDALQLFVIFNLNYYFHILDNVRGNIHNENKISDATASLITLREKERMAKFSVLKSQCVFNDSWTLSSLRTHQKYDRSLFCWTRKRTKIEDGLRKMKTVKSKSTKICVQKFGFERTNIIEEFSEDSSRFDVVTLHFNAHFFSVISTTESVVTMVVWGVVFWYRRTWFVALDSTEGVSCTYPFQYLNFEMDKDLIRQNANSLERTSWILVFFGLLTQLSADFAFPSYNVVIGFWGAYCSFSKHGRATFACVAFTLLSLILDIVFCNTNRKYSLVHMLLAWLIFKQIYLQLNWFFNINHWKKCRIRHVVIHLVELTDI